jgi:hypothetical protein
MLVNADRHDTPAARIAYVNSRLRGSAYALILQFIKGGDYQVSGYDDVLENPKKHMEIPISKRMLGEHYIY